VAAGGSATTNADDQTARGSGCATVFSQQQAREWNDELADYIIRNGYSTEIDPSMDRYFSTLKSGRPQIFRHLLVATADHGATSREHGEDASVFDSL